MKDDRSFNKKGKNGKMMNWEKRGITASFYNMIIFNLILAA